MKVEIWCISKVKPYANNPRHNDAAVDAVAASIRQFGFRQPIVVDADGVIIVGHTRYKAALKLGLEKVPVHVAKDLTPEQIKAYRIADNKSADLSDWNYDLLPIELAELQGMNYDLGLLGFDQDELAKLMNPDGKDGLTDPDDVPAPPDEATTKPGDLWLLGDHRLLCGDSSKPDDVDRLLDGAVVHLCVTDPPYNVKVEPRSNNAIRAGLSTFEITHHQKLDVVRHPSKAEDSPGRGPRRPMRDRPAIASFASRASCAAVSHQAALLCVGLHRPRDDAAHDGWGRPASFWVMLTGAMRGGRHMDHDKQPLSPSSLTVADAAQLLTKAGGRPVSASMIEVDLAAGAPANADGTINLVHYATWLVREMGSRG